MTPKGQKEHDLTLACGVWYGKAYIQNQNDFLLLGWFNVFDKIVYEMVGTRTCHNSAFILVLANIFEGF